MATRHPDDLSLVEGVLRGDRTAEGRLDELIQEAAARVGSRFEKGPTFADEVSQKLRVHLLMGVDPPLKAYRGEGSLKQWLRAAALRTSLNLTRGRVNGPMDDAAMEIPFESAPDLDFLRAHASEHFRSAFRTALKALSAEDRLLVRALFLDKTSVGALAAALGLHRNTVGRRLETITAQLRAQMHALLGASLSLNRAEVDSLFRAVQDRVDVSLTGLGP